jgi:hypothetical protein
MAIPKAQLETWANPGALTTSAATYGSIRHALLKSTSPVANLELDIFLQGSYGNSTNIYGDSDIDVVALYTATFSEDVSLLTAAERQINASSGFCLAARCGPYGSGICRQACRISGSSHASAKIMTLSPRWKCLAGGPFRQMSPLPRAPGIA